MSEIKLQVGKTYRNRKGEEVEIVWSDGPGSNYPYQGSNLEWYTESGRWEDFAEDAPEDLIEEVTVSDANQKHNEMEVLALQVGKTYINRKGEEVRIVGKNNQHMKIYQGGNGGWYAENGKWGYLFDEHPEDIIKEVPETCHAFITPDEAKKVTATRYTFAIPDGTKGINVSKEGNRLVVEMVPEDKEPKPGDVMVNDRGSVYIFKDVYGSYHKDYAWLGDDGRLVIGGHCFSGRPATPEEAQPLWDALKKAGKRWNTETMQVEEIPEIDRILEWVEANIKDGYYNHEDVAEAIEAYLNQKEDKK